MVRKTAMRIDMIWSPIGNENIWDYFENRSSAKSSRVAKNHREI